MQRPMQQSALSKHVAPLLHSFVDREHDSNKEKMLIIGNFSKKRNCTPDTSRTEYSRIPLQKMLSSYTIW